MSCRELKLGSFFRLHHPFHFDALVCAFIGFICNDNFIGTAFQFTKFFALHFVEYGLKKLISTSFAPDSNPAIGTAYAPTLFEMDDPKFDEIMGVEDDAPEQSGDEGQDDA